MFSYHTHTEFCDGKSTIDEFCKKAIQIGISHLGFSGHAPVPYKNRYSLKFEGLYDYRDEVIKAKLKYKKQIEIYLGLEADYTPKQTVSFDNWRNMMAPDYIIGSVHLVKNIDTNKDWFIDGAATNYHKGLEDAFNGDIGKAVGLYFSQIRDMVINEKPDVIGHFDKVKMNNQGRYFTTSDSWYLNELKPTLEVVKAWGCIVEINSRGLYKGKFDETFPGPGVIKECVRMGIPLTLASDSHHVDDLKKGYVLSMEAALLAGVKELFCYTGADWEKFSINDFIK